MNLKIWHKLALILIAITTLTVVMSIGLSQRSFKKGFLDYLYQQQQRRLENLGNNLLMAYDENGDWEFIRDNNRLWFFYLRARHGNFNSTEKSGIEISQTVFSPDSENRLQDSLQSSTRRLPGFKKRFPKRALLDDNKQLIVGRLSNEVDTQYYPLKHKGHIIAYIQSEKFTGITDRIDKVFAAQQSQAFLINTLLSLILSVLVALLVSVYFRRRINALTQIAQQLTSGQYQQRVVIKHKDELGQLGEDFNTLAKTLQKNQESQQQWIADISHELRTPVAILKGELEALDDDIRPLDKTALMSLIQESERLNKLINDLYQLSISDMGALKYVKQEFVFNDLISEIIDSFETRFEKQNLSLRIDNRISDQLLFNGDKQRLYQLLSNILENSLRYTDAEGEVVIHCQENDRQVMLSIEDSAPGITADKLPRIFDRLFRLESSRSRANGGAGLGLAIARQIVIAHQGDISAQSSERGGIIIKCVLPK